MIELSEKGKYIMQNMVFVPYEGINCNTFSNWLIPAEINDRRHYNALISNEIDSLIELGFIQTDGYEKIMLHPLIQKVTLDDTKPSVESCKVLVENLRTIYLFRGIDFDDRNILFETTENIIKLAEKNNVKLYREFLMEAFAYIEKHGIRSVTEIICTELETLAKDDNDKAVLYDYKSAYEIFYENDLDAALKYSLKAVNLCDKIIDSNPRLASNIYSNLAEIYRLKRNPKTAIRYLDYAKKIVKIKNLPFTNDDVTIERKYGNLLADTGRFKDAIKALKDLEKELQCSNPYSLDFADLLWDIGVIYRQIKDINNAGLYLERAYFIYSKLKASDEDFLKDIRNKIGYLGYEVCETPKLQLKYKNYSNQ